MDTYKLNCFIVLADCLNYTKASSQLQISQPALSKIIAAAERELGFPLFDRNKRGIALSSAGLEFLVDAKRTLTMYNFAVQRGRNAALGLEGVLRIGFLGHRVFGFFPELLDAFRSECPGVTIKTLDGYQTNVVDALRIGRVDVALITESAVGAMPSFQLLEVVEEEVLLAVHKDSPYASCEEVDLASLKDETFLVLARTNTTLDPLSFRENILAKLCVDHDFFPKVAYVESFLNFPLMVGCGVGIASMAASMQRFAPPNVRFVRITGPRLMVKTLAAYNASASNPCLPAFLEVCKRFGERNIRKQ